MSEKAPEVLRVENLHSDDEHSCALVALRGLNRITINHSSTTIYHVIAGEGVMYVGGVKYELKPGVIVEVPPGVPYYDEGQVDMEVTCVPPFNPADVEVVSGHQLFRWYQKRVAEGKDPEIVEATRRLLEDIGVVNLQSN